MQEVDRVEPQQVPLMGYKHFPQEVQTYPVSREPVTVQLTVPDKNSALLDLPNVHANLPASLTPQQSNQVKTATANVTSYMGTNRNTDYNQHG